MKMKALIFLIFLIETVFGDFTNSKCTSTGWSCYDCYNRKYCLGTSLWEKKPCLDGLTNNQYPYCDPDSNKCTTNEPEGCKSIAPFKCFRNDLFPDLLNCTKYFACAEGAIQNTENCPTAYYFKSSWGKCVFKTSAQDCETVSCPLTYTVRKHPDDSSLYYECKNAVPHLKGCPKSTDIYDVNKNSCQSICTANSLGLAIPNKRKCGEYYRCEYLEENYLLTEHQCDNRQGFNQLTKSCEKNYDNLCNELAMIETDLYGLLKGIPLATNIYDIAFMLFKLFKFNPYTIFLNFSVLKMQTISQILMILDYFIKNKMFPPIFISNLLDLVLGFLPVQIRNVVNLIISYIPLPFGIKLRGGQHISFKEMFNINGTYELADQYIHIAESLKLHLEETSEKIHQKYHIDLNRENTIDSNTLSVVLEEILEDAVVKLQSFDNNLGSTLNELFKQYRNQLRTSFLHYFNEVAV